VLAIVVAAIVLIGAVLVLGFSDSTRDDGVIPNGGTAGGLALVVACLTVLATSSNLLTTAFAAVSGIVLALEVRSILAAPIPPPANYTEFGTMGLDLARGALNVAIMLALAVCVLCLAAVAVQLLSRRRGAHESPTEQVD
jgi:hypothetical protein